MRFFLLFSILILSCSDVKKNSNELISIENDSNSQVKSLLLNEDIENADSNELNIDNQMQEMYLLILDSSNNYNELRDYMIDVARSNKKEIDSMGRFFNHIRNKLVLPDSSEDEIYAGEYFPRRYESDFLSIEYNSEYFDQSDSSTMCIVAGIYDEKDELLKAMSSFSKLKKPTIVLKTKIYMGCLH